MRKLQPALETMSKARGRLLSTASAIPSSQWRLSPGPDVWCVAEVIGHLTMVEGRIIAGIGRMIQQPPSATPLWKKFHIPPRAAEWRVRRVKSPIPLDPSFLAEKEMMLQRLQEVRQQTLQFVDQTRERDLTAYRMTHPFLGSFDFYTWLRFLAHHEVRHMKQIHEIVDALQN